MVTDAQFEQARADMKEARQVASVMLQDYMSGRIPWSDYVEARKVYREADAELADLEELLGWT